jgi:hypothetical protein
MGATTSEVSYTIATTRRENHEVHKNRWLQWRKKKYFLQKNFKTFTVPRHYPLVLLLRKEVEKMRVG